MLNNIEIEKLKKSSIFAKRTASKQLKMSASSKVSCIWLASPKNMTIDVKNNAKGTVKIFGPTSYSPIETIEESGSASVVNSNVIIILKPTSASGSVTAQSTGENVENIAAFNYLITPTGNATVTKTSELPKMCQQN